MLTKTQTDSLLDLIVKKRLGNFRPYSGTRISIHGEEFRIINDDTVEAVVDDPKGVKSTMSEEALNQENEEITTDSFFGVKHDLVTNERRC